jgi:hypothetical protein
MSDVEQDGTPHVTPLSAHQYTAGSAARHRSSGTTRRLFFFGLSSIWGLIVGIGGLLAAMSATGQSVEDGARVIARLIPALAVAVAGGLVIAAAYKESRRRSR